MSIKSILVPMNAVTRDRESLDLALAVARQSTAHIHAVFARPDPRRILGYMGVDMSMNVAEIMDEMENSAVADSKRSQETFRNWREQNDLMVIDRPQGSKEVTVEWREEIGAPDRVFVPVGRTVDLIVETGLHASTAQLEAVLFETGRPVLIAPKRLPADLYATAVVAWNGSAEANHALAAAMGILSRCEKVLIFSRAEPHRVTDNPDGLVSYFAWHGIESECLSLGEASGSIGEDILKAAGRARASLLVMGAYTHGRLRQMVFGGATSHVMHHTTLPVLLAH